MAISICFIKTRFVFTSLQKANNVPTNAKIKVFTKIYANRENTYFKIFSFTKWKRIK